MPNEAGYVNFSLQAACVGAVPTVGIRKGVLDAAIVPARRAVRAEGGSFVGAEGAKRVKAKLDGLKARLLNGEIPFTPVLQNRLCVALGVEGYNAFVREYNGK